MKTGPFFCSNCWHPLDVHSWDGCKRCDCHHRDERA